MAVVMQTTTTPAAIAVNTLSRKVPRFTAPPDNSQPRQPKERTEPMTTYTLRNGDVVTSKDGINPTIYVNRTQAYKAAAKIEGATVIHRGRPFYVCLSLASSVVPSALTGNPKSDSDSPGHNEPTNGAQL
jgi:hypothetical protein